MLGIRNDRKSILPIAYVSVESLLESKGDVGSQRQHGGLNFLPDVRANPGLTRVITLMSERILTTLLFSIAVLLFPAVGVAQEAVIVPDEVKPFVDKGRIPIALETGDLNADLRKDYILVLSDVVAEGSAYEEGAGGRSVIILLRDADASLSVAARNDLVAMCKRCGGAFGDPFEGVVIRGTGFTVMNYSGSADRWSYSYTFDYSRRDRTWQLVRVDESSFHTLDPERTKKLRVYAPPKNFGLITFADFNPDSFRGKGKR